MEELSLAINVLRARTNCRIEDEFQGKNTRVYIFSYGHAQMQQQESQAYFYHRKKVARSRDGSKLCIKDVVGRRRP
jgi:hypothetical protein